MKRSGLSLIEVIFSAALISLIFLFLLNVLPGAMMGVRQAEHRVRASALAQSVLDECLSGPFANLAADGAYTTASPGPMGDMLRRQPCQMDDATTLEPIVEVSGTGIQRDKLARVRVTIRWREKTRDVQIVREMRIASVQR